MARIQKSDNFYSQYWSERRARLDRIKARGEVLVTRHGAYFHVAAPMDPAFRQDAIRLGATWMPKLGVWSFHERHAEILTGLLRTHYGIEPRADGRVTPFD